MRFYTRPHRHYCGIDLHVKTMYVCVMDASGQVLVHRNVPATPAALRAIIAPYREDLLVAAECMYTWYWVADACAADGVAFVLGHALAMRAIHGSKAKNDKIDSYKIASLARGGLLPQAYVYPARMRATRDLLRRRLHLTRKRGQLLAHVQHLRQQYQLAADATGPLDETGIDPSVQASLEADRSLVAHYDTLLTHVERTIEHTAQRHDAPTLALLRSVPGIGPILGLTLLYEIQDVTRFDRVQQFASYARLVKGLKQSAGKTLGTSGAKMGNVYLKWAFSEAAVQFLRHTPEGKRLIAQWQKHHGKGKALSILAHKLGRTVFYLLSHRTMFSMEKFLAASA